MVIIHYEVEYGMNRLVLLNDIKTEKKVKNIMQARNMRNADTTESKNYKEFEEKFCIYIDENASKYNNNMNHVTQIIKKLFFIDSKQPFIDLINYFYDDCLGTNTLIKLERDCMDGSNFFIMSALDDYRKFIYKIGIYAYDCSNVAIYIKRDQVDGNFENVVNFQVKKNMYKKACDNEEGNYISKVNNKIKIIVIDSNVEVPNLFQFSKTNGISSENYELNIFKSWKYDFKKLVQNNIYLLAPLKIFDFKKRFNVLIDEGYSEEFIKEEIIRFFKEINVSLERMKSKGKIEHYDIEQMNSISMELFRCFIKNNYIDLLEMC